MTKFGNGFDFFDDEMHIPSTTDFKICHEINETTGDIVVRDRISETISMYNLPMYTKVINLPQQRVNMDNIRKHLNDDDAEMLINCLTDVEYETKSYALGMAMRQPVRFNLMRKLNESIKFKDDDDNILISSLICNDIHVLQYLAFNKFNYLANNMNPFHITLCLDSIYERNSHCVIAKFEILRIAGYDILMDDFLVFKHSFDHNVIKYLIDFCPDIKKYLYEWNENIINLKYFNYPRESLKLLLNHGADIKLIEEKLVKVAMVRQDLELLNILIEYGTDIRTYESLLIHIGNYDEVFFERYENPRFHSNELDENIVQKLSNLGCDISKIHPRCVRNYISTHDIKTLNLLIDSGYDMNKIFEHNINNNNDIREKIDTYKLLISCGVDEENAVMYI
jgi:hypothetical protein